MCELKIYCLKLKKNDNCGILRRIWEVFIPRNFRILVYLCHTIQLNQCVSAEHQHSGQTSLGSAGSQVLVMLFCLALHLSDLKIQNIAFPALHRHELQIYEAYIAMLL